MAPSLGSGKLEHRLTLPPSSGQDSRAMISRYLGALMMRLMWITVANHIHVAHAPFHSRIFRTEPTLRAEPTLRRGNRAGLHIKTATTSTKVLSAYDQGYLWGPGDNGLPGFVNNMASSSQASSSYTRLCPLGPVRSRSRSLRSVFAGGGVAIATPRRDELQASATTSPHGPLPTSTVDFCTIGHTGSVCATSVGAGAPRRQACNSSWRCAARRGTAPLVGLKLQLSYKVLLQTN